MRTLVALALMLIAAACGSRNELTRSDGRVPPVPAGVDPPPGVAELLTPPPQAAPTRVDDPIKRSRERADDPFDLPPT